MDREIHQGVPGRFCAAGLCPCCSGSACSRLPAARTRQRDAMRGAPSPSWPRSHVQRGFGARWRDVATGHSVRICTSERRALKPPGVICPRRPMRHLRHARCHVSPAAGCNGIWSRSAGGRWCALPVAHFGGRHGGVAAHVYARLELEDLGLEQVVL